MAAPVQLREVSRRYGVLLAVDRVSLEVQEGAVFGLLGPNGSGKTTLFRLLLGLEPASSGTIVVFGRDQREWTPAVRRRMGFLGDAPHFYEDMAARPYLELFAALYGLRAGPTAVRRWLAELDMSPWSEAPLGSLSHGMRQRIALCRALLHQPELLLLDDPTVGLDPLGIQFLRTLVLGLARQGTTVVLASHLISEVEKVCTHVGLMRRGRLVAAGTLPEVCRASGAADAPPDLEAAYLAVFGPPVIAGHPRPLS